LRGAEVFEERIRSDFRSLVITQSQPKNGESKKSKKRGSLQGYRGGIDYPYFCQGKAEELRQGCTIFIERSGKKAKNLGLEVTLKE